MYASTLSSQAVLGTLVLTALHCIAAFEANSRACLARARSGLRHYLGFRNCSSCAIVKTLTLTLMMMQERQLLLQIIPFRS